MYSRSCLDKKLAANLSLFCKLEAACFRMHSRMLVLVSQGTKGGRSLVGYVFCPIRRRSAFRSLGPCLHPTFAPESGDLT